MLKKYLFLFIVALLLVGSSIKSLGSVTMAKFEINVDKNKVYQNEYYIVSASLLVPKKNDVEMSFFNLGEQIDLLKKTLIPSDSWYFERRINQIIGKGFKRGNDEFQKIKFLELAICPINVRTIQIPSLELKLITINPGNREKKSTSFFSDPRKIEVLDLSNAIKDSLYSTDFYHMIGEYKMFENIDTTDAPIYVGDTLNYSIRFVGEGNLFPFDIKIEDHNDIAIIDKRIYSNDTIRNSKLRVKKYFDLKIITQKPGLVDFSKIFSWNFYSTKTKSITKLAAQSKFNIIGIERKRAENKIINPSLVIALDVSESMAIEDYAPTRLDFGIKLTNEILLEKPNTPVMIFAGESKRVTKFPLDVNISNDISKNGTAIGGCLWEAVQILKNSTAANKKIIIICDGDNTTGPISEIMGAKLAKSYNIKIDPIGIGHSGKVVYGQDEQGKSRYLEGTYKDESLKQLASDTNGTFRWLEKNSDLEEVVKNILN